MKAYHRRAVARMELKQYKEAKEDVQKLLILQPSDKEAKAMLRQIDKQFENLKVSIFYSFIKLVFIYIYTHNFIYVLANHN